jgi:hypothetical protein
VGVARPTWSVHNINIDHLRSSSTVLFLWSTSVRTSNNDTNSSIGRTRNISNERLWVKMLAAHNNQENLVHHQAPLGGKQQVHGTRHLQPKTPGTRYPNTPLKIPLNDENNVKAGKSVIPGRARTAGNENTVLRGKTEAVITPLGMNSTASSEVVVEC